MSNKQRAYYFRVSLYRDYLMHHPLYSKETANQLSTHMLSALSTGIIDDGRFFEILALTDYHRIGLCNWQYHIDIQKCNCQQAHQVWRTIRVHSNLKILSEKYISVIRKMLYEKQDIKTLIEQKELGPQLPDYVYVIEDRTYIFSMLELVEDLHKNCNRYTNKPFMDTGLKNRYLI